MTEDSLIEKLKNGDMSAFDELYNAYAHKAIRTAYLLTNDKFMAEDIVQEAFIQSFKNIGSLKNNSAFKPWFFKTLTRLAYKEIKKNSATPVENIFEKCDSSHFDNYFKDSILYDYIYKLSFKHKNVLILYYYNDMSIKEIALTIGCYEGTVKSRLNTARKKLKSLLEKDGVLI